MHTATHIVRAIDGTRKSRLFSDACSFGRSIKVWGWSLQDYERASDMLDMLGIRVRIIRTRKIRNPGWCMSRGENLRLWIYA